jgi:molybdate transport system permease protein
MHLTPAELDALRLSLEVAARSVLFSLPVAIFIAWLLTRGRFAGRWLLDAFVHLPLVLPPVAIGYVLLLLFGNRGPIGGWLHDRFGIQLAFTLAGAALATAVMAFPLMVRSIRLALENVDPGLEAAARTLRGHCLRRRAGGVRRGHYVCGQRAGADANHSIGALHGNSIPWRR